MTSRHLRYFHIAQALLLMLLGTFALIPGPWHNGQIIFGMFASVPIISLVYLGFGLALAVSMFLAGKVGMAWPHRKLSQFIGLLFTTLAIGGFISGPQWLNLFTNTFVSNVLYALLGSYYVVLGFFHRPGKSQA